MPVCRLLLSFLIALTAVSIPVQSFSQAASPSSSSAKHATKAAAPAESGIEAGGVVDSVYRNKGLGLSYKIPAGWVLRTEEMNAKDEEQAAEKEADPQPSSRAALDRTAEGGCPHSGSGSTNICNRVLLAVFSRPPEARGEDVNASVVIAAESVEAYPGLKEAAQYFGPLTEVATAQGFSVDEEPYEFEVGPKKLVRGDFHKDVGTRVMRQSSLVWLARGYAVSMTIIGGTEDEVEGLIDAVMFAGK